VAGCGSDCFFLSFNRCRQEIQRTIDDKSITMSQSQSGRTKAHQGPQEKILQSLMNHNRIKGGQKQKRPPVTYTDTDTLLGYIKKGQQTEFRTARKFITNEDRLKLAEAIVGIYPDEDSATDLIEEDGENDAVLLTPPQSPSDQTQEQWLELLLEAFAPDPKALRNLAEELIKEIGKIERKLASSEEQSSQTRRDNQLRILSYVVHNNENLCSERDEKEQTLFHIAAAHGAVTAIWLCLSAVRGCCNGEVSHHPRCPQVKRLLMTADMDGHSALGYAVVKKQQSAAKTMLNLLGNISPEEVRKLLRAAITNSGTNSVDIIRELLTARPAEEIARYRSDVLQQSTLQLAAQHFNLQVFQLLLDVGSAVLERSDCNLIHYVVYIGQLDAAKHLLKHYPHLATKLHIHPIHQPDQGSHAVTRKEPPFGSQVSFLVSDADEEKLPVLALYKGNDVELRDLIFETLMERLPISEIREHLGGDTWTGREISLDVAILAFDPLSLGAFIDYVRSDLEALEDYINQRQHPPGLDNAQLEEMVLERLGSAENGGIEFERILKYVNIPAFQGQPSERRTEAVSIFQWLKTCKQVKRVFEVTVNDSRHCPTTEEDIERALRDLNVQHLDWRRTDLSITSISRAVKGLKTLHLYSSGSYAAIDHWLGPNGIKTLDLEQLCIHIIQDEFVSKARADECKRLCEEADLKVKNTPVVVIESSWNLELPWYRHHGSSGVTKKQSPIEVTGLKHFIPFYTDTHVKQLNTMYKDFSETRTKIAILDSGVNGTRFPLGHHVYQGQSFVWRDNGKGHESEASWWLAVDPHGSQMANIISQLDPTCLFYFFQIADNMNYIELPTVIKVRRASPLL
jgi:hypothetical protein